jgi:hypothetical protein
MSWGNKLVIVFLVFAVLMGTLVFKSVNTKFELVSKDYYKDELRFQDKIDGAANAAAAGEIILQQTQSVIILQLPVLLRNTIVEGEAWFYCKTNAERDRRMPVKIKNGQFIFDKSKFQKDSYELKLQLNTCNKKYYFEKFITIQ